MADKLETLEAALAALEAEIAGLNPEAAPDAAVATLATSIRAFDAAAREALT